MSDYIYVKLIKKWGGFKVGDVIRFGTNKGEARIAAGEGIRVVKQREVNRLEPKKEKPKVETASIKPKGETAIVTPFIEAKKIPKIKKKAKKGSKL